MSPHDPTPTPRTVDADVSEILVYPRRPGPVRPSQGLEPVTPELTGRRVGPRNSGIGLFGWVNISFVLGSCLIALFCTLFVSENVQHFRRRAHLADDVVYSKADVDSATRNLSLDPSQLVSSVRLDRPQQGVFNREQAGDRPGRELSPLAPRRENQSSSLSPNVGGAANNGPVRSASWSDSNNATQSTSRATASRSTSSSSSSSQPTRSVRSSTARMTRRSAERTVSQRSKSLSNRQSFRQPSVNSAGKSGASKSAPISSSLNPGNSQLHQRADQTQIGAARSQISPPGIGQGSVQLHGAMNPMHMESGMLAQPGLGGVTGNGGIGQHAGHLRR